MHDMVQDIKLSNNLQPIIIASCAITVPCTYISHAWLMAASRIIAIYYTS